jgi:hypothetical protein
MGSSQIKSNVRSLQIKENDWDANCSKYFFFWNSGVCCPISNSFISSNFTLDFESVLVLLSQHKQVVSSETKKRRKLGLSNLLLGTLQKRSPCFRISINSCSEAVRLLSLCCSFNGISCGFDR